MKESIEICLYWVNFKNVFREEYKVAMSLPITQPCYYCPAWTSLHYCVWNMTINITDLDNILHNASKEMHWKITHNSSWRRARGHSSICFNEKLTPITVKMMIAQSWSIISSTRSSFQWFPGYSGETTKSPLLTKLRNFTRVFNTYSDLPVTRHFVRECKARE